MLTPDYLKNVSDDAVNLYARLEKNIIKDIVRRLKNTDFEMTESAKFQIQVAQESGKLYDEIIGEVSKNAGVSEKTVKKIFENSAIEALSFDDKIYKAHGLNPIPIKQSESMLQLLKSTLNKTNGSLYNLTLTTANTSQQKFIEVCNDAYMEISSGAFDYNTAISNAVKKFGDVQVEYDSGYKLNIQSAVKRAVMTGVNQTCLKMQEMRAEEMGCDLVEVTAHAGARPEHAEWQGKIYSRSGKSKKYPDLVEATGYGTGPGLGGWNCRHNMFPYFEGTVRTYTDEELEELKKENESSIIVTNENTTPENLLKKLNISVDDYKTSGKYDPFENDIQEKASKVLNMHELPNVVDIEEYKKYKGDEIVRYLHSYHGKTAEEAYKNTLYGKIQYSENTNSSYGRGIYFGEKSRDDNIKEYYSYGDNKCINAKISKDANIIEFKNQNEYIREVVKRLSNVPSKLQKVYEKETSLLFMLDGVDGIKIESNGYYCIYNRKVLIIVNE